MIATCRDPDTADGLHELASQHGDRLQLVPLDVTSEDSIQVSAGGSPLDVTRRCCCKRLEFDADRSSC